MTRSTDECEMSRSCHSATFSSAACRLPRSTRARPHSCSDLIGFRLCGIALEPFCSPSRNGSSASRTSVRWRWRISSANDSIARAERRARVHHLGVAIAREHLRRRYRVAARGARTRTARRTGRRSSTCRPRPRASRPRSRRARAAKRSRSRRTCIAHSASFTPNVVGSAWMPWVRPTIGVSRNSRARRAIAASRSAAAAEDDGRARASSGARARCRRRRSTSARSAPTRRPARRRAPARRRRTRRRRGR